MHYSQPFYRKWRVTINFSKRSAFDQVVKKVLDSGAPDLVVPARKASVRTAKASKRKKKRKKQRNKKNRREKKDALVRMQN